MNEKLSLWDRIFNRYTKKVTNRGTESWNRTNRFTGVVVNTYIRDWVEYTITDRVTGSETIKKEYLD